jgi:hypothetical protein
MQATDDAKGRRNDRHFKIILIDAVGREERSSEWFSRSAARIDIRCAHAPLTMLRAIERDALRETFPKH